MPLLTGLKIALDAADVLKAQGADPEVVRQRSPQILEIAQRAVQLGVPLLEPVAAYRQVKVKRLKHERLELEDGASLSGKLIARQLGPAREVAVVLATIGPGVEQLSSALLPVDPPLGLALDALGTAAVDALAATACRLLGQEAEARGMLATLPINPGLDGWALEAGQKQIFAIIPPEEAGITLTSSGMMVPQKSLSLVIGLGKEVDSGGKACDFCSIRNTCRYQDQYA